MPRSGDCVPVEATPLDHLMLDIDAIAAVAREIDHLRAAAATCMPDDRPDLLARLASPLVGFCLTGNWYRTASGFLEQALTRPRGLSLNERVACRAALLPLHMLGSALTKLTAALHMQGLIEAALAAAQRAREQLRIPGFAQQAMADGWSVELAPAFYAGGQRDIAAELLCQGGLAMRRNGVDLAPNQFLEVAGIVEYLHGEHASAARLLAAVRSGGGADREVMAFRTPAAMALYRHYLPLVRRSLGAEDARRLREEGRGMTFNEAFDYALERVARI